MSSSQRDEVSAQGPDPSPAMDGSAPVTGSGPEASTAAPADNGVATGAGLWAGSGPPAGSGLGGESGWAAGGPAGSTLPGGRNPWKATPDGRTVFRRVTPLVLWWIWIAFAIFNVAQVVIPDHNYFSLEVIAGLLAVTGVAYAAALRPRVIASDDGILVHNPVADHLIRWGAISGVYLGDSVELSCARPAPSKDKTVYCWALYSNRRSKMKQQQFGVRTWLQMSSRAPAQARELPTQDASQLIAAELGRRATSAREAGVPPATLESRWAWQPIAAILLPAAALLGLLLAR